MGLFICVSIEDSVCLGIEKCGNCISKCPVNIFTKEDALPSIDSENEDECTFCNLCIDGCVPNCILITKEYE